MTAPDNFDDATVVTPHPSTQVAGGSTGPLAVGQAFGVRYHVIKVLGVGGMGAVYQVWDAELGQGVALKVIRPEAAGDPEAAREMERRFKQELVLARQVTHKNVVRIHDLGEINGIKYITMPYLDGSDLATVLKRDGKLAVPAALQYHPGRRGRARRGARSRHRASRSQTREHHARRRITPSSWTSGSRGPPPARAPVMPSDRPVPDRRRAPGATDLTMTGTILGTVRYMAPEQAKGESVDQRADLYALGLIFSDMLLGARSGRPEDAYEELKRRMENAPPPVRSVDATIPEPIDRIISRCLEPDPAKRYQTTSELAAELARLDQNGKLLPLVRRVDAAPGGRGDRRGRADPARRHALRDAPRDGAAGTTRARFSADRRFPERHERSHVEPHVGTHAEAGAGRRRIHQRVRPRGHRAQPRGATTREARRSGRAGDRGQAGRGASCSREP